MAWITNTVEDDPKKLEKMFWPTPEEEKRNNRKNLAAQDWENNVKLGYKQR